MEKKHPTRINRREFFTAGGGLLGLAALGGRSDADAVRIRSRRRAVQGGGKSRVALVRADNRAAGVKKALEILDINPCRGRGVLLKPNFNTSDRAPGSTHNDTLKALLEAVRRMGAGPVTVADRSGPEPTAQVITKKGIPALAGAFDADVLNLDDLGEDGYVKINRPGFHWSDGFLVARPVVDSECVIQTCCLKTHQYGGIFTMSLKNSVGIVPREGYGYMRELHGSKHQRRMIAEINTAYQPGLVVLDGLEAFIDGGPMTGEKKTAEVFLAGSDRVAVDAVGVAILKHLGSNTAIMDVPVFAQEQIARAVELGLGAAGPDAIELVTTDPASESFAGTIRRILAA